MSGDYSSNFVELCKASLKMSGVVEGETVAVLRQGELRPDYGRALREAAEALGAHAYEIVLPDVSLSLDGQAGLWKVGQTPLGHNRPVIEVLKQADLVIDTLFLLFSKEQLEIQKAGVRMLLVMEPVDLLERFFPSREIRERVEVERELLSNAKTLRFSNDAGTDVVYQLGTYPVVTQYGHTDIPGRWDHWSGGFAFTGGADDGVDGKVVIDAGDILLPHKTYVQSPIELTIEKGRIIDIRGGIDAQLLSDYMAAFDDDKAYGIAHIGWGLDHRARWSALATDTRGIGMEVRCFYGNVLFSTGPNGELGGTNDTACHVDIPMRNCSLFLDDEPILLKGEMQIEEMKPAKSVRA